MNFPRRTVVRALGVAGALTWVGLALTHRQAWPRPGWLALGVGLGVALALRPLLPWFARALLWPGRLPFVGLCAVAAAGISWWTLWRAFGGQLLSIDSGVYLMQARALSHAHFGFIAPHPAQDFGDRFVLEGPDGWLYGIFPPGWPLALAPFAALGHPMAAGPTVAVLLVVAQAALGRQLGRAAGDPDAGELATRGSLLLSLTSIGRALETADLLSHAFVAALAALAVAGALALGTPPAQRSPPRAALAAAVGACVGWVFAARLLDGLVLAAIALALLAMRARSLHASLWAAFGAAPLLGLLALEQRAATGSWLEATQALYFARSDWPPTCHRLGLGPDIGCSVEHPGPVARLGGDGFFLPDAVAVTRERASALGEDLTGWPPLLLLVFVPAMATGASVEAVAACLLLSLTLAYGLFYYGNVLFFGARHLFPAAPFVWLAVARGVTLGGRSPAVAAGGILVLLGVATWSVRGPWAERTAGVAKFQEPRSDLRRTAEREGIDRGILKTHDLTSLAAAFDPWRDDGRRLFTLDDGSGLLELRRAHPDLPVLLSLAGDEVGRLYTGRPAPGILVELERTWPTFVRPAGLGARQDTTQGASGGSVLLLSHASPGASVAIPFETSVAGRYEIRVDTVAGPDEGDFSLDLDGVPLPDWHGYAESHTPVRGERVTRTVDAARHVLTARCTGRSPASSGFDARLDAFVGVPVAP